MKNKIIISAVALVVVILLVLGIRKIFIRPLEPKGPQVAIVIDDWGYNLRPLKLLKDLDIPITVSILPNLRYSSRIAKEAHQLGHRVILHLPMEPETKGRKIGLEKDTILSSMSDDEIRDITHRALNSVPYATGVSSHMGSAATKDRRIMSVIFAQLKAEDLFFLDSLVVEDSVGQELAHKMRLRFASRDFFLDNLDDKEYIREQFDKLIKFAQEFGYAIGIAHAKVKTLKVLREQAPLMEELGIEFVFISDLIE